MAELTLDQQRAIALANARKRAQEGAAPQTGAVSSAAEAPSAVVDAAAALPSGVVRGAVETAMLPVTAKRLMDAPGNWLAGKLLSGGEALVRAAFGMAPASAETLAARQDAQNSLSAYDPVALGQDAVRAIMGNTLYEPKTTAGEYAGTIGEFMAPGGLPSKATRLAPTAARKAGEYAADVVRQAVVPAALSQGAGDIPGIQGTAAEPVAEVAGALLGNVGGALGKAASAPETVVRRAIGDPTKIDWPAAVGLQNNQTGVRLTGPEAIAQAMGGASALPNVMRVVEGSIDGGVVTAPFFAQRPAQIGTAVNSALDKIAPQSTAPSSLGPRVSAAAENVLDSTRQGINASTRPLYAVAAPQTIPDAQFAPIAADPRFQSALARLRGNPELAPDFAGMPDNSVAVVDAITKDMFARGEAMGNAANPLYGPYLGGLTSEGAAGARNAATNASPEYAQALAEQAAQRQNVLAPMEQGPIGQIAGAPDTAAAGNALLPRNPMVGSESEIGNAVARLMVEDPQAVPGLVRQNLADRFNTALTETQQGAQDFAGAKFYKDVAGNPQRAATLDAVLASMNNPEAQKAFPELLNVLQATGRRRPIGSATEFNRSINADLGAASPFARTFDMARSLGASWLANAGDAAKRAALRNSLGTLAEMFTDPNSVELIRAAAAKGAKTNLGEALMRAVAQSSASYGDAP